MQIGSVLLFLVTVLALGLGSKKSFVHYDNDQDDHDRCITEKCIKLPRAPMIDINVLVAQPEMLYTYGLNHKYDCSQLTNVKPPSGSDCYTGRSHISTTNSSKLVTSTFANCPNNEPCATAYESDTGLTRTWYVWDYEFSDVSSWMCAYTCRANGEKFEDFFCATSNDVPTTKIKRILKQARCICNGRHIRDTRMGCPEVTSQCPI